jgi:large subunit ribosomal protein L21
MFAVVKTGGKQYKVAADLRLRVEKLAGEPGDTVEFDQVLMIGGDEMVVGTPTIEGAVVRGEVLEQIRGPKVISFVKRRRKHSSQRKRGHRQYLTVVRITDILPNGAAAAAKAEAKAPKKAEKPVEAKAEPASGAAAEPVAETVES